jgi:hypothetical protein
LELWPLREITVEEIYFKKEIDYGMLQSKNKVDYLVLFYEHQPGEILILDEVVDINVKDNKIVGWTIMTKV